MAKEEIMKELDRIEKAIFMEQMADFMNWNNYRQLKAREQELKNMLNSQEINSHGEKLSVCASV